MCLSFQIWMPWWCKPSSIIITLVMDLMWIWAVMSWFHFIAWNPYCCISFYKIFYTNCFSMSPNRMSSTYYCLMMKEELKFHSFAFIYWFPLPSPISPNIFPPLSFLIIWRGLPVVSIIPYLMNDHSSGIKINWTMI